MMTCLLDVPKLTTVTAERDSTIHNESGGCKTQEVLVLVLGPAYSHSCPARLLRELDSENELTLWVTDHVDNGHVDGDVLLESDEIYGNAISTKSGLNIREGKLVDESAGVSLEAGTEAVQILLIACLDDFGPGLISFELRNTGPVDKTALFTLESLVALLVTKLALHGIGRAAACSMSLNAACVARAGEFALDTRVGTIRLVVTNISAVEAFASQTASGWCVGALASEVAFLATAEKHVSTIAEKFAANKESQLTVGKQHRHHRQFQCQLDRRRPKSHHQWWQLPMRRRLKEISKVYAAKRGVAYRQRLRSSS